MNLTDPQPPPTPGTAVPSVDLVVTDLAERKRHGVAKYGVAHQHDNGRDHLVDLYQELLDGAVYIRAEIERRRNAGPVDAAAARDALADECAMLRQALRDAETANGNCHAHIVKAEAERDAARADYEGACKLVAQMHAAAIGGKVGDGPRLGVLEDVVAAQRALAAAQADNAQLRAVLQALLPDTVTAHAKSGDPRIHAALATPAGDEALREFGLKVAQETARAVTRLQRSGTEQSHEATVDAVLRGEP